METLTTKVATDNLDRAFRYQFWPEGKPGWYPISFPGLEYTDDGLLTSAMKTRATQHLLDVLNQYGCVIRFSDGADVNTALRHVLWDQWRQAEIGNGRFIGRMFDDQGLIYHGCTADDAARYTLERVRAMGGNLYSITLH